MQVFVGGREVLLVEPGPVRGQVRAGLGDVGQKRVGEEDDLLLGFARVHRVDGEQVRRQFAGFGLPRSLMAMRGSTPAQLVSSPRRDLDHLPAVGAVERGSAASRRCSSVVPLRIIPTTTIGATTRSSGSPGAPDPFLGAQPHPQAVQEARTHDVDADALRSAAA